MRTESKVLRTTPRRRAFPRPAFELAASNRPAGFTLVEILIVVIILGILAAVVIPQFSNASQDSRIGSVKAQLQNVRSAIGIYQMQHMDQLPDLSAGWTPLLTQTTPQAATIGSPMFGPYLPNAPVNALTGGTTVSTTPATGIDWVWNAGTGTLSALDTQGNIFIETP